MKKSCVAAICGGVVLSLGASAAAPSFTFWTTAGSSRLYGNQTGPGTGAFRNYNGPGLTIKVAGSRVGGVDATFTGIQQILTGTYGPFTVVDVWWRSRTGPTSVRLQDALGQELLTAYFDAATLDWYPKSSTTPGVWGVQLSSDRLLPSRVERGPLLDGVLPQGTIPEVYFRFVGSNFGQPSNKDGVLEFMRGEVEPSGYASFVYACRADFNNDTVVDDSDFAGFVQAYATMTCKRGDPCRADFNDDGFVDDDDFATFASAYDKMLCN